MTKTNEFTPAQIEAIRKIIRDEIRRHDSERLGRLRLNNETKHDVFEVAIKYAEKTGWIDYDDMLNRYDEALPDDLPVIPLAVGEYIKGCQSVGGVLVDAFACTQGDIVEKWVYEHSDTFAIAWLLGVWRVEETGEIVKLEARDETRD